MIHVPFAPPTVTHSHSSRPLPSATSVSCPSPVGGGLAACRLRGRWAGPHWGHQGRGKCWAPLLGWSGQPDYIEVVARGDGNDVEKKSLLRPCQKTARAIVAARRTVGLVITTTNPSPLSSPHRANRVMRCA